MATKQLTIRLPADFHQQLVKYAEEHYLPVSRVITQAVAKTIAYKPQRSASRSAVTDSTPVAPQYWDGTKFVSGPAQQPVDEFGLTIDEGDDLDMDELQRRANSAPYKPIA